MKIRMIVDTPVAPDGCTVAIWAEGEVRETYDQLALDLIKFGKAERAKASEPAIVEDEAAGQ